MYNNPNLDLVSINAYTKIGKILSICSQDIEQKQNYDQQNDGQNDGQPKASIAPFFSKWIYTKIACQKACKIFSSLQRVKG